MRTMKRSLSWLLAFVMIFAMMSSLLVSAFAADPTPKVAAGLCGDTVMYDYYDATPGDSKPSGVLTIKGIGPMWDYQLDSTSKVDTPWMNSDYAFDVVEVVIYPGVTTVGSFAFYNLTQCKTVTIPEGVTSIGEWSFAYTAINKVHLPSSVKNVRHFAFSGSSLRADGLSNSTCAGFPTIDDEKMGTTSTNKDLIDDLDAASMGNVVVEASGTLCQGITWSYSSVTKTLTISSDYDGFVNKDPRVMIDMLPTLENPEPWPWKAYQPLIENVYITKGISNIGEMAFSNLTALKSVTIGEHVETIGDYAFNGATTFKGKINLPEATTKIGDFAFGASNGPITIVTPHTKAEINGGFSLTGNTGVIYRYADDTPTGTDVVTSGTLANGAISWFYMPTANTLTVGPAVAGTKVAMPNFASSDEAPWDAFDDEIETVIVYAGITQIGKYNFADLPALQEFYLIEGDLVRIYPYAVANATSLTSIHFPNSVSGIDEYAFYNCNGLTSARADNNYLMVDPNGNTRLYALLKGGTTPTPPPTEPVSGTCGANARWEYDASTKTLTITGSGATTSYTIGNPAPWKAYMTQIENLIVMETIDILGAETMSGATALKTVKLPSTLLGIGADAFKGCNAIQSAYADCPESQLTIVTTGNETLIAKLTYKGGNTPVTPPPSQATSGSCGDEATWAYDTVTKTLIISGKGATTRYTTESPAPWVSYMTQIEKLIVEEGIEFLSEELMYGASALKDVKLPSTLYGISTDAFKGCTAIQTAYVDCTKAQLTIIPTGNETLIAKLTYKGGDTPVTPPPSTDTELSGTCGSATTWTYDPTTKTLTISGMGATDNYITEPAPWAAYMTQIENLIVEEDVMILGSGTLSGATALKNVQLPSTIMGIYNDAFNDCNAIQTAYADCEKADLYVPDQGNETLKAKLTFKDSSPSTPDCDGNHTDTNGDGKCDACGESVEIDQPEQPEQPGNNPGGSIPGSQLTWTYDVATQSLTIKGNGVIPNYTASSPAPWAQYASKVTSIMIQDGITGIGDYAFANMIAVIDVYLPKTLTGIGKNAFAGCTALKKIDLPKTLTTLGDAAFRGCSSLEEIEIPAGIQTIAPETFRDCIALEKVTLNKGLETIGKRAFYNCSALSSIEFPTTLREIGEEAFWGCSALKGVTIKSSPLTVRKDAFAGCSSINKVILDGCGEPSVEEGNESLTDHFVAATASGTLSNGVMWEVDRINGTLRFYGNGEVIIDEAWQKELQYIDTVIFDNGITGIANNLLKNDTNVVYVTIADTVTSIGNSAFELCQNLRSVSMSKNLATLGAKAFAGCRALTSVVLPDTLTVIPESAFASCGSLASVTLGKYVTVIGTKAFENCSSLQAIVIPDTVTTLSVGAFSDCAALSKVTLTAGKLAPLTEGIFNGCSNIKTVIFNGSVAKWDALVANADPEIKNAMVDFYITWTVNYVYKGGPNDGQIAFDPIKYSGKAGTAFTIIVPTVEYYTPSSNKLDYTFGDTDQEFTIHYTPNTYTITVEYVDAATGKELYSSSTVTLTYGQDRVIYSYNIPGYTARLASMKVDAATGNKTVQFEYDINRYTYRVEYKNQETGALLGFDSFTVDYQTKVELTGADMPAIKGYTQADFDQVYTIESVESDGEVIIVYYTPNTEKVTVHYVDENGNKLAEDKVVDVKFGTSLTIESPAIFGKKPAASVVIENYDGSVAEFTVVYEAMEYTITVNFLKETPDGDKAYEPMTFIVKHGEDFTFVLADYAEVAPMVGYEVKNGTLTLTDVMEDKALNVIYDRIRLTLTIHYVDENGQKIADDREVSVLYGDSVSVPSPVIEGMKLASAVNFENFTGDITEVTVKYERKEYKVTVNFVKDQIGGEKVYESLVITVKHGDSYVFDLTKTDGQYAPKEGYEVKTPVLSLENITANGELNVVYTLIPYDITIEYVDENGNKLAEDKTVTVLYGQSINVVPPVIENMKPATPVIIESFKGGETTITIKYERKEYNVTVNFVKDQIGGEKVYGSLMVTVKHGDSYVFDLSKTEGLYAPKEGYEVKTPVLSLENITANGELNVVYTLIPYDITIEYVDENGNKLAEDKTFTVLYGQSINVESPVIKGMKPAAAVVVESFKGGETTFVVSYEREEYTVTVNFVKDQIGGDVLYKALTFTVKYGDKFSFDLTAQEGNYAPGVGYEVKAPVLTIDRVEGDTELNMVYTLIPYDVTIEYVDENGNKVAEDKTITVLYGGSINVESPVVENMKPADAVVIESFKGEVTTITVKYERKEYKVTIHFQEMDSEIWEIFPDLEIMVKHGDTYTFVLADHPEYLHTSYQTDVPSVTFENVTADGMEATITYTLKELTLTVEYKNEAGEVIYSETLLVKAGKDYIIGAKTFEGYVPTVEQKGTMGLNDMGIVITLKEAAQIPDCDGNHVDANKDGKCDQCDADVEIQQPGTDPEQPGEDDENKGDENQGNVSEEKPNNTATVIAVIAIIVLVLGGGGVVFCVLYLKKR